MQQTPKSLRLHIALLGRVNAGKSSFLNLVTGQQTAIVSELAGTTTDVVEKAQELPPLGPVLWLDTAGFGDTTDLADKRMEKTARVLDRADVALLVCRGDVIGPEEMQILTLLQERKIPHIKIYNQTDKFAVMHTDGICVNSTDAASRERVLNELTAALIKICPDDFLNEQPLVGDLLAPHSTAVMMIPLDYEVVKEDDYAAVLNNFKTPPALAICDSQVVDIMVAQTPAEIKCTTFSILMARFKGNLQKMVEGAAMIDRLQDGDKVLIAEACTHHAAEDDIGRVKIPRWLKQKTGKDLQIDVFSGCDFATDLAQYKLVIQCGGCTINRREVLSRIQKCAAAGVAITNYGVCISELKGVLMRVLEPFGDVYEAYLAAKQSKN